MALERNEPVFLSPEDEQKYRQVQHNFSDACKRINELSEFVLKLREAEWEHAPKLAANGPYCHDPVEVMQVVKSDYDLFIKWKSLLRDFKL